MSSIKKIGTLTITVHPKHLAHCRLCREPMYCIYDWMLRDYCHQCTLEMKESDPATSC